MACHNYDGDMLTDEVAQAPGSLGGTFKGPGRAPGSRIQLQVPRAPGSRS